MRERTTMASLTQRSQTGCVAGTPTPRSPSPAMVMVLGEAGLVGWGVVGIEAGWDGESACCWRLGLVEKSRDCCTHKKTTDKPRPDEEGGGSGLLYSRPMHASF